MMPFHQSFYKTILKIHWLVIAIIAAVEISRIFLNPPFAHFELISLALLAVLAALAPYSPRVNSGSLRFGCALLEFVVCTAAACFGVHRLYPCLYATILARYSTLVNLPLSLTLVAVFAIPNNRDVFPAIRKLLLSGVGAFDAQVKVDPVTNVAATIIYIAALVVFVLAIRYLNIEQDSRKQAQRLMLEIKDLATELERSRLAREIHDSLGHSLTALNMQLEVFATLHEVDPQRAMEAFSTARRLATAILDDVRAVVHSIRHEDFQFEASLSKLIDESQQLQAADIKLDLRTHNIPKATAYQLYNIMRECLTNSLKHADPHVIQISLRQEGDQIVLECSDDGSGFNAAQCNGKGYGMHGMKERAESLGGTLSVQSAVGSGTKVCVTVPAVQQSHDSNSHS